jgi:hypothetical protein
MTTSRFISVDCGAAFNQSAVIPEGPYRVPCISPTRLYD